MANSYVVVYNIAVSIAALFMLEFGADKLTDHVVIVARRTKIPDTVIGLITIGGEWEELAVVIASLARGRASLAMGNIIGSAIANILGAFSLGLLFYKKGTSLQFDRSSRVYSLFLLTITTFAAPIMYFSKKTIWLVCGPILITIFAIYLGSVGWQLKKGNITVPEDSEDESNDTDSRAEDDPIELASTSAVLDQTRSSLDEQNIANIEGDNPTENETTQTTRSYKHALYYHILYLIFGFLAICLAGWILSQAATNITDEFDISDLFFGVAILAIATTLPEKFVAIFSGRRGNAGILVASTAGSNIFLLSLCFGVVVLDTSGKIEKDQVKISELGILWGSTLAFTLTIWLGRKISRWIGAAMVLAYIAFIVLEFKVIHNIANVA